MSAFLDALFGVIYAGYVAVRSAFRFVDFVVSVVYSATSYTAGAAIRSSLIVLVQVLVVYGVYYSFFPPELPPKPDPRDVRVTEIISVYPVLSAFVMFAAGETFVVVLGFGMLRTIMKYKFEYVFGSDVIDRDDRPYTPFDDESTAASDPLTF